MSLNIAFLLISCETSCQVLADKPCYCEPVQVRCCHSPGIFLALWIGTHMSVIKSAHQGVIWRETIAELALQAGGGWDPPLYFLLKTFPLCRCAAAEALCQKPAVTYRAGESAHICLQRRAVKGLRSTVSWDYVLVIDSADCHEGKWRISQGTVRALHNMSLLASVSQTLPC